MTLNDVVALMRGVSVFGSVEASRLKLIAYGAATATFHEGAAVIVGGAPSDSVVIIESGVLGTEEEGGPRFERGDVLGDLSILAGVSEPQTVVALTAASTVTIPRAKFEEMLQSYPELQRAYLKHLASRMLVVTRH